MAKKENPIDRKGIDQSMQKFYDHLGKQNFQSEEELRAFLDQTTGKKIDDLVPEKDPADRSKRDKAMEILEALQGKELGPQEMQAEIKKALDLYPNLVEAHLQLSYTRENIAETIKDVEAAIAAGAAELGAAKMKEYHGHFWGFHETRPYMRAKYEYALLLREMNKYEKSLRVYHEILELNPPDNMGVRYAYGSLLIQTGKYLAYEDLLEDYEEEGTAHWLFNHAVYMFKRHGKSVKANQALAKAHQANPYILPLMAGEIKPSETEFSSYSLGSKEEAEIYLQENIKMFAKDKKMQMWLFKFMDKNR